MADQEHSGLGTDSSTLYTGISKFLVTETLRPFQPYHHPQTSLAKFIPGNNTGLVPFVFSTGPSETALDTVMI